MINRLQILFHQISILFSGREFFSSCVAFAIPLFFSANFAFAAPKFNPKGFAGHAGAGFAVFTPKNPTGEFKFDQGVFASLGGEKGFGVLNLFLTFTANYLTANGQIMYDYTPLGGNQIRIPTTNFKYDLFEFALGLKFKLIDGYFFRPYVEGGGSFGYSTMKYTFNSAQRATITAAGVDAKDTDSLLGFGTYAEGGVEVNFSDSFGFHLSARFMKNETKEFQTLANKKLMYETQVYYISVLKQF